MHNEHAWGSTEGAMRTTRAGRSRRAHTVGSSVTRALQRPVVLVLGLGSILLLVGCSGASSMNTTTTAAVASASVDDCLIGTWRSTAVTGVFSDGGAEVLMTGGSDEIITIESDGSYTDDYTSSRPTTGDTGINQYVMTIAGTATGHIVTSGATFTFTVDDPSTVTWTLTRDGVILGTAHPPSTQAGTAFTCQPGTELIVTSPSGESTTTYRPD